MTVHLRGAIPKPSTLDLDARTVEAIVATGAGVDRPGYIERLDMRGADLSRLVGAPVLDAHRTSSTRDQLGVVEAAELRPEGIWVRLRFRSNDTARAILTDIADGTLCGLSVGYGVAEWKETQENGRRVRTAAKWTPVEVSIVPVPADPAAHFRTKENIMPVEQQTADPAETTTLTRAQINAEIRSIAATAGLTRDWADQQIDAEATADEARADAFEAMRTRSTQAQTRTVRATITQDHTDPAVIATRAGEALYARAHPGHVLSPEARAWGHMTIPDISKDCLVRAGVAHTGASAETLVTRALHTTSDFPLILGDVVNRTLRAAYQAAPSGARQLGRQTTNRDFRPKRMLTLGEAPELEKVTEGGEFKHGTINESGETYRLETFGKIFGYTRQAMVNDDLGALTAIPAMFGVQAANFEAKTLVALIEANPTMSDGVAVFHAASHGNYTATATTITPDLNTARVAMRRQKGLAGMPINVTPKFVLVPPERETEMEMALSAVQAATTDDVNPFASLTLVVEPRLTSATRWFVVADPALIDGLEYAYLEGAPGPQVETKVGFEVDGLQIKVRLDFGAGWIDHRGWYRIG